MSKYKLISFDMDDTLLNSNKELPEKNLEMINKAFDCGKEVILSTGRCVALLKPYIKQIPRLRYINCSSGALVYDLKENKEIYSNKISIENISKILEIAKLEENMVSIQTTFPVIQQNDFQNMKYFGMEKYMPFFEKWATKVEDIRAFYKENGFPATKINLYHASLEGRARTRERLKELGLVMIDAEAASLEISAAGVTKAVGLRKLCECLGISIEETIAVGDANNDLDILKTAGLSVAMGNANEAVKEICDVTVRDCDHDGCAEAIEKYLLSEVAASSQ